MAQTQRPHGAKSKHPPEFLRESLEAAQSRLEQFEREAQRVLKDLMDKGRASRKEFEQMVHRLSKQDWSLPEMRHRLEKLRDQGAERATEWRGKAESFRSEAMERVMDLQGRAASFLGVATRDEVAELSREIDRLARRIQTKGKKPRARKGSRSSSPEA